MNLDAFAKSAEKTEKSTTKLDDVMRGLNPSALSAVAGVTTLVGAFKGLVGIGSNIVDMASHFETVRTELGTVLQDAEKGAELFEDLRKFSFDTTFGVDELASASTQLLNAGKSAKTLQKDLKMLGDLAGGDKNKFAELTSIFSKVATQGKATSVQLQQINLRGIPITKTLKEMGVTGVASAEELTEAFKKLTEEGGQFHNAMDNIINTIEGKRGFISDTLKEISVNFGEVSGITDTYKSSLDVIYKVLDKVNNLLMKINENPVIKSIIQGIITVALSGMAGLLVGSLIPAIKMALGLLTSFIASNPITLIMSGIAMAVTGFVTIAKKLSDAKKEMNGIKKIEEEAKSDLEKYGFENDKVTKTDTQAEADYKRNVALLEEAKRDLANYNATYEKDYANAKKNGILDKYLEGYNQAKNRVSYFENAKKQAEGVLKTERDRVSFFEKQNDLIREQTENYQKLKDSAGDVARELNPLYDKQRETEDIQKQIEDIKKERDSIYNIFDNSGNQIKLYLDAETKAKLNKDIDELQKKLKSLEIEIAVESQTDNQKMWQDMFGFNGEDVLAGATKDFETALGIFSERMDKINKKLVKNKDIFGIEELSLLNQEREQYTDMLKYLYTKSLDDTNEMVVLLKQKIKEIDGNIETISKVNLGSYALDTFVGALQGASSDLNNFVQGMAQSGGNWLAGIINMLIGAIFTVIQEVEDVEKVLNPVTEGVRQLKPFLQFLVEQFGKGLPLVRAFFSTLNSILVMLEPIFDWLFDTLDLLSAPLSMILAVLKPLAEGLTEIVNVIINFIRTFDILGWVSSEIVDSMVDSIEVVEDELTDKTRDLTYEYDRLLSAMEKQEEWYLKEKTRLNAQTRSDSTSVNDMILTPQGNFSTHPDDYIIATKNPNSLGSGSVFNMVIKNEDSGNVDVSAQAVDNESGGKDIFVSISRKIANDVSTGANGWDSAFRSREKRLAGRKVSF